MAVYPVPYVPQPAYAFPPRPARTPQGLKWMNITFYMYIGYIAMVIVFALAVNAWIGSLRGINAGNIDQALSGLVGLCGAAVLEVVLGILVLVFGFMALGYLYGGRNEYGPGHAHNLQVALYLLIGALVTWAVQLVVGQLFPPISTSFPSGITINANAMYISAAATAVTGVVIAALMAAVLVLSVRELARPEDQRVLYVAAALGTATPGITGALTILGIPDYVRALQGMIDAIGSNPTTIPSIPTGPGGGVPALLGGLLAFITILLFLFVYYNAGLRVRSGEVKAVVPPAPAYGGWMPAPVVPPPAAPVWGPPPSGPPAQPPVQPPAQPPGQSPAP